MRVIVALAVALTLVLAGCLDDEVQPAGRDEDETEPQAVVPEDPGVDVELDPDPNPESLVDGDFTASFVDVGQGDAVVLQWQDQTVVFDTGDRFESSHGALIDHLERSGTTTVDALILSHPHADHAGGCSAVIEGFQVSLLIHPGVDYSTQTWQGCLEAAALHDVPTSTGDDLVTGQILDFLEPAAFQVLHVDPDADDVHEANLALRITYGAFALVLPGDLECGRERIVIDRGFELKADVLNLGHHGSRTSTCTSWLDAVDPAIAVAGLGEDNAYGHPHKEVIDRLDQRGIPLYRTDHNGTITVTTDGTDWEVTTEREGPSSSAQTQEASLDVSASLSDAQPCQYTSVQVHIEITQGDAAVPEAEVVSTWHYATTSPTEESVSGPDGTTVHERYISGASPGHTVVVEVEARLGDEYGFGTTEFTPQEC